MTSTGVFASSSSGLVSPRPASAARPTLAGPAASALSKIAAAAGADSVFVNLAEGLRNDVAAVGRRADASLTALRTVFDRLGDMGRLNAEAAADGATAATKGAAAERMTALASEIEAVIAGAGSDGVNWLEVSGRQEVAVSAGRRAPVTVAFDAQRVNDANPATRTDVNVLLTTSFDAGSAGAASTAARIEAARSQVAVHLSNMNRLADRIAMVRTANDISAPELGRLVLADLNAEGAALMSMQVRQQMTGLARPLGLPLVTSRGFV